MEQTDSGTKQICYLYNRIDHFVSVSIQGFVKGEVFCFRYPDFYFLHGESASTASQISKDLNKVPLLLQNLGSVK